MPGYSRPLHPPASRGAQNVAVTQADIAVSSAARRATVAGAAAAAPAAAAAAGPAWFPAPAPGPPPPLAGALAAAGGPPVGPAGGLPAFWPAAPAPLGLPPAAVPGRCAICGLTAQRCQDHWWWRQHAVPWFQVRHLAGGDRWLQAHHPGLYPAAPFFGLQPTQLNENLNGPIGAALADFAEDRALGVAAFFDIRTANPQLQVTIKKDQRGQLCHLETGTTRAILPTFTILR